MKKVVLIVGLFMGLLISVSCWAQGNIAAGKQASNMCASCHGESGNSAIPQYPNLAGQHANYLSKQLRELKLGQTSGGKQGRFDPIMSAMAVSLTDDDINNLAAYYASLPAAQATADPDVIAAGKKLYTMGNEAEGLVPCSTCHGANGYGNQNDGFPRVAGQNSLYLQGELQKFRSGERHNDLGSVMHNVAKAMSDKDIETLSLYINSLK